jgi:CheY-like chemotaxis protein
MMRRVQLKPKLVPDGKQALMHGLSGQYPLIFLDINMPEMSGLEVARELVAQLPRAERPYMIALTAHALTGDRETCLAAGMDDYLSKPLQMEPLLAALRRAEPALLERAAWKDYLQPFSDGMLGDVLNVGQLEELQAVSRGNHGQAAAYTFVAGLVTSFESKASDYLMQLEVLVPAYETLRAQQICHNLLGASSNVGARSFTQRTKSLEQALKQRDSDQANRILQSLRPLLAQTMQALSQWLHAQQEQPPSP